MAVKSAKVTATRIIEYHGTPEWIENSFKLSRVAIQGTKQWPDGSYIKSGVIMWQPSLEMKDQEDGDGNESGDRNRVGGMVDGGGDRVEADSHGDREVLSAQAETVDQAEQVDGEIGGASQVARTVKFQRPGKEG